MKYQVLPLLSIEEYEALKADIAENGVQVAVVEDEHGEIIDGHHRVKACREIGLKDWPRDVREELTDEQKIELAYTLNYARRQVSKEQKQRDAARLRQQGWSYRKIARVLGVHFTTIENWVEETGVEFSTPATVTGVDGKQYPATKPESPTEQPPSPKEEAEEVEASGNTVYYPETEEFLPDEEKKPHVSYNSGENEWYTPSEYIEAARVVMKVIDLDPASSEIANRTVKAARYYSKEDDGLSKEWSGRVWMNPPYSSDLIGQFCNKLVKHYTDQQVSEAIVLVNNATETAWFNTLIKCASAVMFPKGRVRYETPGGETGAPLQGQAVIYMGDCPELFMDTFSRFGWCAWL